jgi:hypothetical protein
MKRLAGLMALAVGVATAAPPEADRIATFTVNAYLDDADAWSSDIGLNVPVGTRFRTFGTVGYSSLESERLAGAPREVGFAHGSAGLGYERGGFSGDLSLSLWGDDEFVATRDLRVGVGYDTERFGIRLSLAFRDLDLTVFRFFPEFAAEKRSFDATSGGLELSAMPGSRWRLYAGGEVSDYPADIGRFADSLLLRPRLLAQRPLTLSSTFTDWSWHAGTDLFLRKHRLNIEYAADTSIFGGLDSSAASVAWQLPLGADSGWTLDLRVGQIRSEGSDRATFGVASLALFY